MLVFNQPVLINNWVHSRGGGKAHDNSFSALGWAPAPGLLTAGLVFYDHNGAQILVNIALDNGRFPIPLLKAGFFYAFSQLNVRRLTFIIAEINIKSQTLVRQLGAVHEATLRDADKTGNLLIFALFPENCKLWSRFKNGKIRRQHATGSGPD